VPEVLDLRSQVFAAAGNHQLWFNRSGELQPVPCGHVFEYESAVGIRKPRLLQRDPHATGWSSPDLIEPELMVTGRSEYLRSEIENLGHDPVRCGDRSLRRPPDGLVPARKDQTYARYIPYISVLC